MTLCLAWKRGDSFSFASDSRLSGAYGINSDMATKIYRLQVRITDKKSKEIIHDLSWGMCFCGSYLNGSVVANIINEFLSSLQIDNEKPIDGKAIINVAFEIFKEISNHLIGLHGKGGFSRIMIGGKCPASGEVSIYHFNWKYVDHGEGIEFTLTQEAFEPSFIAIGDGNATERAKELSKKIKYYGAPLYTEYHLLRDIIDDEKIEGVGGPIQTGHFVNGVFRLYGMVDYEIKALGKEERPVWVVPNFTYLGIPFNSALKADERFRIDTSKISMAPFTDKEKQLVVQAKEMNGVKD